MSTLKKKAAIITGATGGIGSSLCRAFAEDGYRVIGSDKDVGNDNMDCHAYITADLHRFCWDEQLRMMSITRIRDALDGLALVVLINNAALQIVKPIERLTMEDWSQTLNVNLIAPFLLSQAFLPELEAAKGSVINVGSIHATQTKPEFAVYSTSKSALSGLSRSLAVELGRRIRINTICPAAIATNMLIEGFAGKEKALVELEDAHPIGRIGQPEEVAALALFLASDKAGFINGAEIGLDGGIRSRLHDPT